MLLCFWVDNFYLLCRMKTQIESKVIDHLGLVSGMYDELRIGEQIDALLPQNLNCREVSIGTLCKALVLNGLGFVERRLYMVSDFFSSKPIDVLLGEGIKSNQLNDSVLDRALDDIYEYGTTKLFSNLVPSIHQALNLSTRFAHMDSTDFHVDGMYNSSGNPDADENVIRLVKGYSRDHRPDLNQVVLNLIADNQAGIPLHMEVLSGNISDKSSFRRTIKEHINGLQNTTGFEYLVMDSAGYTQETISKYSSEVLWISRVPETIKSCKEAIATAVEFQKIDDKYSFKVLESDYGGVKQRWLIIFSKEAYKREIKTLQKNYFKNSTKEIHDFEKLCRVEFSCIDDLNKTISSFKKKCRYISIEDVEIQKIAKYNGKGRPIKGALPDFYTYKLNGNVSCEIAKYRLKAQRKGKFILATNELNEKNLANEEILKGYKSQSKVERGFRFLKDPQFVARNFFVKKPERVDALIFIMTLCLTVYAALEYKLRQKLEELDETIPNQVGKPIKNPTTRWVFAMFYGIHFIYGVQKNNPICVNIKDVHLKILKLMGPMYNKYYLRI